MNFATETNIESVSDRGRTVFYCAVSIIAVSVMVLFGWALDIGTLKTILPNFPEMKPNTALAFALAGTGLIFVAKYEQGTRRCIACAACGFLVSLIGIATLCEYSLGSNVGIDNLIVSASRISSEGVYPARMSPHSAFNFAILGISLALLNGGRRSQKISEFFAILLSVATFASMMGYLYGAEQLYGTTHITGMALHTAMLFTLSTVALLWANLASETGKLVTSETLGGVAARRLIPAVVFVPLIIDWLRAAGQERGFFDAGFGSAMLQVTRVVIMIWIVLFFSRAVHKTDLRRRLLETELAERERRFHDLFNYNQGMICIHDLNCVLITVNPATVRSLGYSSEEMVGSNLADYVPIEHRSGIEVYQREISHEGLSKGLLPVVSKSGKRVMWRYDSILVSEPGQEPYVIGHAQDVTELVEAQKQLKNLSLTDELTGLYNRRGFLTMAEQQIKLERHEGTARGLTLMFADMDGLKQINDRYGHEAGSDAIIALSKIINSALRDSDLVARWGGDEFVILTIGSHDDDASTMTERISDRIDQYNAGSDKPYKLACSIGIAPIPLDGNLTFESIIAEADQAMYLEKKRRKAQRDGMPVAVAPPVNGMNQRDSITTF